MCSTTKHYTILALCCLSTAASGQESDHFRPYLRFHSGDIEPLWGVDDHWSFGLGADLDKTFGVELSLENFERDWNYGPVGTIGEVSAWHVLPELRVRKPLLGGRLVPYLLAGIGPTFLQLNDKKPQSAGHSVRAEGMSFTVAAGGGLEYFLAENIAFGIEGRYVFVNPIDGKVDGESVEVDLSAPTFTFGLRVYFDEAGARALNLADADQANRFYAGVRVGGALLTGKSMAAGVQLEPEESAWGDTVNQTGSLLMGADFGPRFGIEISADSLEYKFTSAGDELGEYGMGVVIPQLRLRFPIEGRRWQPYLTAGIGVVYGEFNDRRADYDANIIRAKGLYPAARVGGGAEYFLASNVSLNADIGWVYSWGHDVRFDDRSGKGDFSALTGTIGFRVYLFDF